MTKLQGGFYDCLGPVAQHSYVMAEGERRTYFECYGGTSGPNSQYPGDLWTGRWFEYENLGKSVSADLTLAIVASSGQTAWHEHFDQRTPRPDGGWLFGDCSGITYGVTGVCHQMANRILYATNGPDNFSSNRCVVWPLSLNATALRYGFFGDLVLGVFRFYWETVKGIYERRAMAMGATAGSGAASKDDAATLGARYMKKSIREHLRSAHLRGTRAEILTSVISRPAAQGAQPVELPADVYQADSEFARTNRELDIQLIRGQIKPTAFAEAVNAEFAKYSGRLSELLGPARFREIFGDTPNMQLVNPAYMLESSAYEQLRSELP